MSSNESLKAFVCPSCGAPLEVREGAKTVICRYCHMTVSIPQEPEPIIIEVPRTVPASARRNRDAEEKQKQLAIAYSLVGVIFVFLIWSFLSKASEPPPPQVIVYHSPVPTHTLPPPYAGQLLTFTTIPGSASSSLVDSKDIDLDGEGNLLVTEHTSNASIVYKLDPEGNFLAKEFETDYNITSFSEGPDRGIITTFGFDVHVYKNGNEEILVLPNLFANDVAFGKDGSFYVVGLDHTITRYDPTGVVNLEINKVFETQLNSQESESHLAVDDLGNMYLLGVNNAAVLKFAPDGSLLGKFDGKNSGYISHPKAIAVDSAGRIFIGEFRGVLVFDEDFRFIDTLTNIEDFYLRALVVDGDNHLYLLTDENTVRKYQLPAVSQ